MTPFNSSISYYIVSDVAYIHALIQLVCVALCVYILRFGI